MVVRVGAVDKSKTVVKVGLCRRLVSVSGESVANVWVGGVAEAR